MWKAFEEQDTDKIADITMIQWYIWFIRNKFIHEGLRMNPELFLSNALDLRQEYSIAKPRTASAALNNQATPQTWQAPSPDVYKLNIDGATFATAGSIGRRAIIRNWKGEVMLALAKEFLTGPLPEIAEAMAFLKGLNCGKGGRFY